MSPSRSIFWLAAFLSVATAASAADIADTRRVDVVDDAFGMTLPDPYRWMEGENNAEFDAWLRDQGIQTRKILDALPALAGWRDRLSKVAGATRGHGGHVVVGDRLFFRRVEAGQEAKLMWRDAGGRERVLFDPKAQEGQATITNYSVSPDGRRVTVNVGRGGNEISQIEVYDVDTGTRLPDVLTPVWSEFNPSWLPDGSGFAYTRMDPSMKDDPLQGMASYLHLLGRPQSEDTLLARADGAPPLDIAPASFPIVDFIAGSDWTMLAVVGARASSRLCFAPRVDVLAGRPGWRCPVDFEDNVSWTSVHGDNAYLLQTGDTPYGRILALDLRTDATLAGAREVVAQRNEVVATDLGAARDGLYVKTMRDGRDHLERLDYASGALKEIALPVQGTARYLRAAADEDGAIVSLEDWTTSRSFHRVAADGTVTDMKLGNDAPADYSDIVAENLEAISADGTRVPLSLLRRKDLKRDGAALALVDGYGGYGSTTQPFFFPMYLEWSKSGHVLAYCHVRGGGEKGDAWRLGGTGINKQRGVEDFIACAKTLSQLGYTTAARTAGFGASMGGVLAGGAYVTEPSAFGAIAMNAPILNPVRLLAAKNGANQISEMGDPRTADGMRQLLAMDPYQRVKDGTRYPLLFVNVGIADQRVAPWNTGKFAARVAHASPQTPIWLRTDDGLGHFPTSQSAFAIVFADLYAGIEAALSGGLAP